MSRPRVVVTGASGLLGRAVVHAFKQRGWQVQGLGFSRADGNELVKVDLHDRDAVKQLLASFTPDVMIHCAAERRPDVAEKNPEAAERLNVGVPKMLAELSVDPTHPFSLIYISTDYVFDGQNPPDGGYTSQSLTGPTNAYAKAKLGGERAILSARRDKGSKAAVLRVPVLFVDPAALLNDIVYGQVTSNDESAINILVDSVRKAAAGEKVKMDDWALRRPTNVADVARVLVDLSDKALSSSLPEIVHFSYQPSLTKYDISKIFASLHQPPLSQDMIAQNLVPVSTAPGPGETIRPRDCWLSNAELEALGVDTSAVDFEAWWRDWFERNKSS
ncbi:hypothetical protein OIV83_005013 [Microbotryomycetes sp. JL201]|nr:hypothetical protein OIV83_005013 [Microbotryomycetes sp. JL201]